MHTEHSASMNALPNFTQITVCCKFPLPSFHCRAVIAQPPMRNAKYLLPIADTVWIESIRRVIRSYADLNRDRWIQSPEC